MSEGILEVDEVAGDRVVELRGVGELHGVGLMRENNSREAREKHEGKTKGGKEKTKKGKVWREREKKKEV